MSKYDRQNSSKIGIIGVAKKENNTNKTDICYKI
jgi:hypothetical protein